MYKHMLALKSQAGDRNKWELFLPGLRCLYLYGMDGSCLGGGEGFGWVCWWSRIVTGTAWPMLVLVGAVPCDLGHPVPTAGCSMGHGVPCSSGRGKAGLCSASGWVRCHMSTCTSAGTH